jgi:hypothetical protein
MILCEACFYYHNYAVSIIKTWNGEGDVGGEGEGDGDGEDGHRIIEEEYRLWLG